MKFKEFYKLYTESLSDWPNEWVHYSDIPYLSINPQQTHSDPAALYFFPINFKPVSAYTSKPYKFTAKLKENAKVLDLSTVSREEAVRNYTEKVWKEWSLAPVQDREAGLAEITDASKHLFLVAYVNFKAWKKFPSTYEASLHRSFFVEGTGKNIYKSEPILAEPEGTEEVQFYTKAHTALRKVVDNLEAYTSKREGLILQYYTHVSKEENLEAWAKHLMWLYKNKGEEWLVGFLQTEPSEGLFDWNKVAFTVEVLEVGSN